MTLPVIAEIRVRAVDAPLDPPLRNSLNVIPRAPLVIVDVRTACGAAGTAYVFPYTSAALGPTAAWRAAQRQVGRADAGAGDDLARLHDAGASSAPGWCRSRSRRSTGDGMRGGARHLPHNALLG